MTSCPNNPNNLCICGHNFTCHQKGPIEIVHGRLVHHIIEYKTCCKKCSCEMFNKMKSRWEKFWNGSESENWNSI